MPRPLRSSNNPPQAHLPERIAPPAAQAVNTDPATADLIALQEWQISQLKKQLKEQEEVARQNIRFWPELFFAAISFLAGDWAFVKVKNLIVPLLGTRVAGGMLTFFICLMAAGFAFSFTMAVLTKVFFGRIIFR